MKNHKGLIIGLVAAFLVLVGGAAAYLFAGDYIANSFMLLTKSDEEYFAWLSGRQVTYASNAIKLSDKLTKLLPENNRNTSAKKDIRTDLDVKLHVTDDFCDMFNLYSFKDEELKFAVTDREKDTSIEIVPYYGGNGLLTLRMLLDKADKSFYVQLPEYNEGVVDLTAVFDIGIPGINEIKDKIDNALEKVPGNDKATVPEIDEAAAVAELGEYLKNSIHDVHIDKKSTVKINGEETEVNKVVLTINTTALKTQLTGLVNIIYEKYINGYDAPDKAELINLINKIDASTVGKFTLYVNNRAKTLGCMAEVSVKSTRVGMEIIPFNENGTKVTDVVLNINSLKAADIRLTGAVNDGGYQLSLNVVPGAFVQTFLEGFTDMKGLSLELAMEGRLNYTDFTAKLYRNSKEIAKAQMLTEVSENSEPLWSTEEKTIYPLDELLGSDYFNLSAIANYALGVVDTVNEEFVDNYIEDTLSDLLGEKMTLDAIKELIDAGVLDIFGFGSSEPEPEPEYVCPIDGIVSPDPDEYIPTVYKYPADTDIFRFSHQELGDYASVARYRGVKYTVPVSQDFTEEQYENERHTILNKYVNAYTYDDKEISVEMGDEIYFDIMPMLGSMPIPAYAYYDCYELVGTDNYGEGLDEKILGMKVDETRDVTATLGEDFGDFAGYTGVFRVTLKKIDRFVVPEWTEEFLSKYAGFKSLEAAEEHIKDILIKRTDVSEESVTEALMDVIWNGSAIEAVSTESRIALKQQLYNEIYDRTWEMGMRPEEYYVYCGSSAEQLEAELEESIANLLPVYCFYGYIAREETLTLTGKEVGALIDKNMAEQEVETLDELMALMTIEDIVDAEMISRIEKIIYDSAVISYE